MMTSDLLEFLDKNEKIAKNHIAEESGMGRVIISDSNVTVGEHVIREKPILVWRTSDNFIENYIESFLALSINYQAIVLDMFSGNTSTVRDKKIFAQLLLSMPGIDTRLGHDKLMSLTRIMNLNAHEYYGHSDVAYKEITSSLPRISSGKAALFAYSSKVSHSW